MKLKKFLLAFALLLVIVPCAALFAACGGTPTQSYTVTFVNYDDTVIDTQTVKAGEDATAPADPTRDGYTFAGWDIDFNDVTGNITVKATYVQEFTVTFVDHNGTVLKTETVNSGASATAPANPSRTGFRFDGWDKTFNNVTGNLTVTAKYINLIIGDWKAESMTVPNEETGEMETLVYGDRTADDQDQLTERTMSFSFMVKSDFLEYLENYIELNELEGDDFADSIEVIEAFDDDAIFAIARLSMDGFYEMYSPLIKVQDILNDPEAEEELKTQLAGFSERYIMPFMLEELEFVLHINEEGKLIASSFDPRYSASIVLASGAPAPADQIVNTYWEFDKLYSVDGEGLTIKAGDIQGSEIINTDFCRIVMKDGYNGGDFDFSISMMGENFNFSGRWVKGEPTEDEVGLEVYILTSEEEGAVYSEMRALYEPNNDKLIIDIIEANNSDLVFDLFKTIWFDREIEESDPIVGLWCDNDSDYTEGNVILTFLNNGRVSGWYNDETARGYWTNNGDGTYTVKVYNVEMFASITPDSEYTTLTFEVTEGEYGSPVLSMIVGETSYDFSQGTKYFTVEFKETENTIITQGGIQYMSTVSYERETPEREGFNFLGWKVQGTEDTEIINLEEYFITSNLVLMGVWEISGIVGGTWANCISYTDNNYTETIEYGLAPYFTFSKGDNFNGYNLQVIDQIEGTYTLEDTVYGFSGENMNPVASYSATAQIVNQKLRIQMTITDAESNKTIYYWEFTKNS